MPETDREKELAARIEQLEAALADSQAGRAWALEKLSEMNRRSKEWSRAYMSVTSRNARKPVTHLRAKQPQSVFGWLSYYIARCRSQAGTVKLYEASLREKAAAQK